MDAGLRVSGWIVQNRNEINLSAARSVGALDDKNGRVYAHTFRPGSLAAAASRVDLSERWRHATVPTDIEEIQACEKFLLHFAATRPQRRTDSCWTPSVASLETLWPVLLPRTVFDET